MSNFLKELYNKFPPKNNYKTEIPDKFLDIDSMKKSITKSQQAYHPDKNLSFDDEWKRLTYRISQKLNQIFDTMKSCNEPQLN